MSADEELLEAALIARGHAHCPYSGFAVGAAVRTEDGRVFAGANVENASFGLTVCAERVAIWKAASEGARRITDLLVVTEGAAHPCGACRQVAREFSGSLALRILVADPSGIREETTLATLLPRDFGPEDLGRDVTGSRG